MPLAEQWEYPGGVIALWRTTEPVSQLETYCTDPEIAASRLMKGKRSREFLAWRALLHAVSPGAVVEYDAAGGPVVSGGRYPYIGVSHTEGYAAVILGYRPCAVDIESFGRNIVSLAGKFSAPEETAALEFLPPDKRLNLIWCAKEALFKLHRRCEVDFKRDMQILSTEGADGGRPIIKARFREETNSLYFRPHENLCMVFVWK